MRSVAIGYIVLLAGVGPLLHMVALTATGIALTAMGIALTAAGIATERNLQPIKAAANRAGHISHSTIIIGRRKFSADVASELVKEA